MTGEIEFGTVKVWVRASSQLLKEMLETWSQPVRVKATVNLDGSWEMVFQVVQGDRVEPPA